MRSRKRSECLMPREQDSLVSAETQKKRLKVVVGCFMCNRQYWLLVDPVIWGPSLEVKKYILLASNAQPKKDCVEAEELRAIFLQLPEPLSDDEMEEMLRAGNRSGGGTFNLEDMGWGH